LRYYYDKNEWLYRHHGKTRNGTLGIEWIFGTGGEIPIKRREISQEKPWANRKTVVTSTQRELDSLDRAFTPDDIQRYILRLMKQYYAEGETNPKLIAEASYFARKYHLNVWYWRSSRSADVARKNLGIHVEPKGLKRARNHWDLASSNQDDV
jgi:hypothetical protein